MPLGSLKGDLVPDIGGETAMLLLETGLSRPQCLRLVLCFRAAGLVLLMLKGKWAASIGILLAGYQKIIYVRTTTISTP